MSVGARVVAAVLAVLWVFVAGTGIAPVAFAEPSPSPVIAPAPPGTATPNTPPASPGTVSPGTATVSPSPTVTATDNPDANDPGIPDTPDTTPDDSRTPYVLAGSVAVALIAALVVFFVRK